MLPNFDCDAPTLVASVEAPAKPVMASSAPAARMSASFRFIIFPFFVLRAEVDVRGTAADAFDPDVLQARDVVCDVMVGDDHLHRLERRLVAVAGAVELRFEDGGVP